MFLIMMAQSWKVYDTNYELEDNTSIVIGLNLELNYYLNQNLGLEIGFGYEKINQPNFFYCPVYFNLIEVLKETKDAFMQR
ncbi:hypothetical protein [Tenacibaculum sp. SG-28]|uniref:hypothetical protein n=1 Tax=Tenacibaculum sp. SG-28 TaxID=754426 RepID=UPI0011B0330A|nr:hypothetical protein [Tenacibaculum sp. SG-28]